MQKNQNPSPTSRSACVPQMPLVVFKNASRLVLLLPSLADTRMPGSQEVTHSLPGHMALSRRDSSSLSLWRCRAPCHGFPRCFHLTQTVSASQFFLNHSHLPLYLSKAAEYLPFTRAKCVLMVSNDTVGIVALMAMVCCLPVPSS